MTYWILLYVTSLLFAYETRFTEATLMLGRSISTPEFLKIAPTGLQDAITPPHFARLAFAMYLLVIIIVGFGFYEHGLLRGLLFLVVFLFFTLLNWRFLTPKPDGSLYRNLILRSMISRHADYVKNGDSVRADAMAEMLETAGLAAEKLAKHSANRKNPLAKK